MPDLQKDIKEIKLEIRELKEKQIQNSEAIKLILQNINIESSSETQNDEIQNDETQKAENIEKIPEDFLFVLR